MMMYCFQGILLHPYLSLHMLHLLTDVSVRGFVIGATNALFRQKTHLIDVVVEVSFPSTLNSGELFVVQLAEMPLSYPENVISGF